MIFIQEAEAAGIPFKAVLIEINPSSCQSLKDNIQDRPGLDIVCGDHNDIFPQYFTTSTKWHVGLIYMDMNGIPSFDILTKASCVPCFQRTDILINCPATALKRNNGNIRLSEALSQIKKRYWIVRNPHGPWQWSMLIGSNWDSFPTWEKKGFYRVESAMGQKVLDVLSKTHTELKACQLNMWPTETMLNI